MQPKWLKWAKQLQAIAQAGIEFADNLYDRERYESVRALSIEILHEYTDIDNSKLVSMFANESKYLFTLFALTEYLPFSNSNNY